MSEAKAEVHIDTNQRDYYLAFSNKEFKKTQLSA